MHLERISRMCERLGPRDGDDGDRGRDAAQREPAARRGQDRRPRRDPAAAGRAVARGPRADAPPHDGRRRAAVGLELARSCAWPRRSRAPITSAGTARATRTAWRARRSRCVGRICAVCDVFDALLSDRPYKEPWPVPEALDAAARASAASTSTRPWSTPSSRIVDDLDPKLLAPSAPRSTRASRYASASSSSSSLGLRIEQRARASSTSVDGARAARCGVAALGVRAQRVEAVGGVDEPRARRRPRTATSRNHRPASCSAWSSAPVRARRAARLAASAPSRSARLRSRVGQAARARRPRAPRRPPAPRRRAPCAPREDLEPRALGEVVVQRARGRRPRRPRAAPGRRRGRARSGALGVAEAEARARLRGRRRRRPAPRRAAISSALGASKRTGWQREAIVGRISPGRLGQQDEVREGGGSSSVLSIRLAAWSFIVSARSMTNTRRRASNGVRVAAATTGSSMSATSISAAPLGVTQVRSGCTPCSTRSRDGVGVGARRRLSSAAAKARATSRLPAPAGPVEEVGVAGAAVGRQRAR